MKRVISVLILVLVLVPLMLLMRWGGEAKGTWSRPRDGVQARLVAPRFVWRTDEPVEVRLRLRNHSAVARDVQPVALPVRILHEGRERSTEWIELTGARLEPGAEMDLPLRRARLDLEGPGLYAIDASLDGLGLPALKLRLVAPD